MQKYRVLTLCLACAVAFPALGAAQGAMAAVEQQVIQADKDRFAAMIKVDEATLNKLISDDVVYTHSTAMVQTKKEFVDALKDGGIKYISMTASMPDVKVKVIGNIALVTGAAAVHVFDHGAEKNIRIRYTEVHSKASGSWQLLAWQSTLIP